MGDRIEVLEPPARGATLDEELRRIMFVFQVRRSVEGEVLACSLCGRASSYTYGTLCGRCYLEGRGPKA